MWFCFSSASFLHHFYCITDNCPDSVLTCQGVVCQRHRPTSLSFIYWFESAQRVIIQSEACSPDFFDNLLPRCGPVKGFRILVVCNDVSSDGLFEFGYAHRLRDAPFSNSFFTVSPRLPRSGSISWPISWIPDLKSTCRAATPYQLRNTDGGNSSAIVTS